MSTFKQYWVNIGSICTGLLCLYDEANVFLNPIGKCLNLKADALAQWSKRILRVWWYSRVGNSENKAI